MKKINGFGHREVNGENPREIYEENYRELVNITKGGNLICGILEGIYPDKIIGEFVANLRPSITLGPDDKYGIEYKRPSQISLPFEAIRPLKGTLEDWVKKSQKDIDGVKQ